MILWFRFSNDFLETLLNKVLSWILIKYFYYKNNLYYFWRLNYIDKCITTIDLINLYIKIEYINSDIDELVEN